MSRKLLAALLLMVAGAALAVAQSKEAERLDECVRTLKEILNIPDAIPQELIDKAECVGVIPSTKKGAFGIGASYGPAAAAPDAYLRAEILSYSRSRGLFAGVALEGSTLRQDNGANEKIYRRKVTARQILRQGAGGGPAAGAPRGGPP